MSPGGGHEAGAAGSKAPVPGLAVAGHPTQQPLPRQPQTQQGGAYGGAEQVQLWRVRNCDKNTSMFLI